MQRFITSLLIATAGVLGLLAFAAPIEAGGGGGGGCMEQPREGTDEPVEIRNSCYTPTVLYVEAGTTVTWTNEDRLPHNVTFLDGSRAGDALEFTYRESVSHTFAAAGLFAYYCNFHPSMLGVVAVGDVSGFVTKAPAQTDSVQESTPAVASTDSGLNPSSAGLVLAVGLVSAGGGYLLRRRAA